MREEERNITLKVRDTKKKEHIKMQNANILNRLERTKEGRKKK